MWQDGKIRFDARDEEWTAEELADELEKQMNMAFHYALTRTAPEFVDEDDQASWESAQKVFINEDGIPYGSVQHGIFLNTEGTSVFNYNMGTSSFSTNIELNDVTIHGMFHKMDEWVRFAVNAEIYVTSFTSPLDASAILGDQLDTMENLANVENLHYQGNIVSDVWIALDKLTDNWAYLGGLLVGNSRMIPWVEGTGEYENYALGCNVDAMLHSGKGILGLRLDGVADLHINGLEIYNLYDSTPVGRSECGEYTDYSFSKGGGHFRQVQPMQIGFSGNMVQGIAINTVENSVFENIVVHDLTSETGASFGIAIWPANDIEFTNDITVYNIYAGVTISLDEYEYDDRPNQAPEGCAILEYTFYLDSTYSQIVYETVLTETDANINVGCISGATGCRNSHMKTNVGVFGTVDECTPYKKTSSQSNQLKGLGSSKLGEQKQQQQQQLEQQLAENISPASSSTSKTFNHWSSHPVMLAVYVILGIVLVYATYKFALRTFAISTSVVQLSKTQYSLLRTQMDSNPSENYGSVAI